MNGIGAPELALVASAVLHALVYAGYVVGGPCRAHVRTQVSYFVTLFGVAWSVVLLNESLTIYLFVALGFMLIGMALVSPKDGCMIEISSDIAAWVSIGIVLAMFALFITEIFPTEVVAISGVALMLVLGLLPYDMALNVLSNPAPWTIAGMFIVMGALVRTGP